MPQLVFVHGVATRSGSEYEQSAHNRDQLFRQIMFEGHDLDILSPLWGDLVPKIDLGIFETDDGVRSFSLGVGGADFGGGLTGSGSAPSSAQTLSVAAVAAQNTTVALDAIFVALLDKADKTPRLLSEEEIDAFRMAADAVTVNSAPSPFQGIASDDEITTLLTSSAPASFGIGSTIGNAVIAVTDHLRNSASTLGFGAVRDSVSPAIALFLGDVFSYLKHGTLRTEIQARVREDLVKAHEACRAGKGPLVVIGHSMGGVILIDMFQDLVASRLPADLRIDALLTVGSQPGLFQSLGVLSALADGRAKVPRPPCVAEWINIFDPIDPLAFRADKIFDDVEDMAFDSITGLASAHTTYFKRPRFHARSRARLKTLHLI